MFVVGSRIGSSRVECSVEGWIHRGRGANANTRGLDYNQIAGELARVDADSLRYQLGFRRIRQAIQFQQDYAANPQPLANDQFAKIAILGDQNAVLAVCRIQDFLI